MKENEIKIGAIITSDNSTREKVIALTARKARIVQIDKDGNAITKTPYSIWLSQINGQAGAARLFGARTNYSIVYQ